MNTKTTTADITVRRGNNGNEYTEFVRPDGVLYLVQQSGPDWIIYLNARGAFTCVDSTQSRELSEEKAHQLAIQW